MAKQPTPKKPVVRAGQNKPVAKKPVADKFHPDPDHRRSKPISKPVAKQSAADKFNVDGRKKSNPINLSSGKPKTSPDKSDKNIGAKYNSR